MPLNTNPSPVDPKQKGAPTASDGGVTPGPAPGGIAAPGAGQSQAPSTGQDNSAQQIVAGLGMGPGGGVQNQNVGTGFVNLGNLLSANAAPANQMANQLTANAKAKASGQAAGSAGGQAAASYATGLNSFSGLQTALGDQYKSQAYTPGQSGLDAFLAGAAGAPQFKQAQAAYSGLANAIAPTAPAAAPSAPASPLAPRLPNNPTRQEPNAPLDRDAHRYGPFSGTEADDKKRQRWGNAPGTTPLTQINKGHGW